MTVAGPSLVLPTLSTIFSSSSPPTTLFPLFPQTIVLLHTVREWLPIVLQESERRIIQREKSEESRRAKGKGKAREEGEGEDGELVEIKKLRALLVKGRKLGGKGSTLELVLKAAHIRSVLFSTPTSLSSIPSLIDAYFPRPPPPDQPSSSSSSNAEDLKRLATQRKISQAVFNFVRDFVETYDGDKSDLPSSLASAYSKEEVSKHSNYPWEQLRGWISSWLVKVEGVWDELEQGVGGTREGSTTEGTKQQYQPPQHQQPQPPPAKPKPRPSTSAAALPPPPSKPSPSSTSAAAKRSSGTSTAAMAPPPKKKPRMSKLGGKTTRNMFGGDDDEDSDEE